MPKLNYHDLLGTELPLIQAPMAGVQDSTMAIAVGVSGGLGSIPCGMLSPQQLQEEMNNIATTPAIPFNLNFFCHHMPEYDQTRQQTWRKLLKPYFDELEIPCPGGPANASRKPFDHDTADLLEPYKPAIISFHFGLPEKSLLDRVKAWGTTILASATTIREALFLEAKGVDAIIAQGIEAGGHRGMFLSNDITTQIGTFALLPQIVHNVSIPVIAAGGIVDANGVKAAINLGAIAAQVGTAYLLCDEAKIHPLHKLAITSQAAEHTTLTTVFSGRPARGIINRLVRELGPMPQSVADFPYAATEINLLRKAAEANGSVCFSPLWCGQNATGCKTVSAKKMTESLTSTIM